MILRKQARITYFFQNFEAKEHFAVSLYMIGRFFFYQAARDRVKDKILNNTNKLLCIYAHLPKIPTV
jgi:hypothetical protein